MDLSVGPNPARSEVRIRYRPTAPEAASVEVFDVLGRQVADLRDPGGDGVLVWQIPEALPAGAYTVRLRTREGDISVALSIVR